MRNDIFWNHSALNLKSFGFGSGKRLRSNTSAHDVDGENNVDELLCGNTIQSECSNRVDIFCQPTRIVIYRDSLQTNQFDNVMRIEMRAIREACTELDREYQPAITYIAVTKRHHTRFFCADKREMV